MKVPALAVLLVLAVTVPHFVPGAEATHGSVGYYFIHGICSSGQSLWNGPGASVYSAVSSSRDAAGRTPHVRAVTYSAADTPTPEKMLAYINKDLQQWVREQKLGSVVVVGHSLGGLMAMGLQTQNPKVISRVVTFDTPNQGAKHGAEKWLVTEGACPGKESWKPFVRDHLAQDANGNAPSWIRDLAAKAPSSKVLTRVVYAQCLPRCEGTEAVPKTSAAWGGAVILTYTTRGDETSLKSSAKSSCAEGGAFAGVVGSKPPSGLYHSTGTQHFSQFLAQLVLGGPTMLKATAPGHFTRAC